MPRWSWRSLFAGLLALAAHEARATIPSWVAPGLQLEYGGYGGGTTQQSAIAVVAITTITANNGTTVTGVTKYYVSGILFDTFNFTCAATGACTGGQVPLWVDPNNPTGSVTGPNGETLTNKGTTPFSDAANGKSYTADLLSYSSSSASFQYYYDPTTGIVLGYAENYPTEFTELYFYSVLSGAVTAVNGSGGGTTGAGGVNNNVSLVSSILPSSRSVQVNHAATAFATIINAGSAGGTSCGLSLGDSISNATFSYQTTNSTTNAPTNAINTPVNIAAGGSQSFVLAIVPSTTFAPTAVTINAVCANSNPASVETGINTLLLSSSSSAVPDIVALVATTKNDGILHIPGSAGAFAVATVNVGGASGTITAAANTGGATLPLTLTICQTVPATGQCMSAPGPSATATIAPGATPTFAVFGTETGTIPLDALNNRVYVTFTDSGNVVRGSTSVAVETQ